MKTEIRAYKLIAALIRANSNGHENGHIAHDPATAHHFVSGIEDQINAA